MTRPGRLALIAMTAVTICAAGTLAARAEWNIDAVGEVKARTATIPKGNTPTVEKVGGTAVVSWRAQEIGSGTAVERYVVTAHGVGRHPLPDVTHAVVATGGTIESITFAAGEVTGGTWYWTVVPKLGRWTGAESGHSRRLEFPAPAVAATEARRPAAAPAVAPTTPAVTTSPTPEHTSSSTPPATVEPSETATAPEPALSAGGASVPSGAAG